MSKKLLVPADIYDEALAFCNARRAEIGLEPITELPAGYSAQSRSCPCAKAVPGLTVGATMWWLADEVRNVVGHPTRFVTFFDLHSTGLKTLPVREGTTNV